MSPNMQYALFMFTMFGIMMLIYYFNRNNIYPAY